MNAPVPSERTVRLLGWTALAVGIIFFAWLLTVAAAGTGADLPHPEFVATPEPEATQSAAVLVWRAVNACLAGVAAFGLWLRWFDCRYPRAVLLKAGELLMFAAAFVGQIHMLVLRAPLTLAVPFITVAATCCVAGLLRSRRDI